MKITTNILGALLFIGLSIFILFEIPSQILASSNTGINAQSFPRWIAIFMLVSSLCLLINEIRLQIKGAVTNLSTFNFELKKEVKSVLFVVLMVAYAAATPLIGFLFASIGFSALSLAFFKIKNAKYYIFLIGCCVLVNYVFKYLLLVQLP